MECKGGEGVVINLYLIVQHNVPQPTMQVTYRQQQAPVINFVGHRSFISFLQNGRPPIMHQMTLTPTVLLVQTIREHAYIILSLHFTTQTQI